jgi:hypothetical protein
MRACDYISPFQGLGLSWRCHFIPLHGMLVYDVLSGLSQESARLSPEGTVYANDGYMSSDKKLSPEGVLSANDGYMSSDKKLSPERVLSANDGRSPSDKNKNKKSPERAQ